MCRQYVVRLLGPLQFFDPAGNDITPRGAKAQGMLAYLAVARGRPCNRGAIQDKLWSDRGERQGRDSLKQVLRELHKCVGEAGKDVICTDGGPISLNISIVDVDIFDDASFLPSDHLPVPEFLEGISIRDEEFEAWLREVRSSLASKYVAPSVQPVVRASSVDRSMIGLTRPSSSRPLDIAIMPVGHHEPDKIAGIFGDLLLNRLVIEFRNREFFELTDLRIGAAGTPRHADIELRTTAMALDGTLIFSLTAVRVSDMSVVWAYQIPLEIKAIAGENLAVQVCEIADRLTDAMFRIDLQLDSAHHLAAREAVHGIARMLRLSGPDLAAAASSFKTAIELNPRSSYLAWYSYLSAFRLEEAKGANIADLREYADSLAARALELDPHNPLTRSLLAHVYSFVFRDFSRAYDLITPVAAAGSDSAMYNNVLGLLSLYTGRIDVAIKASREARRRGQASPFRFAFTTTACMAEAVAGNFSRAVEYGEHALASQRGSALIYEPNLRYLGYAYAQQGNFERAKEMLACVRKQTPGFSSRSFDDESFPVPTPELRNLMRDGYREIEKR